MHARIRSDRDDRHAANGIVVADRDHAAAARARPARERSSAARDARRLHEPRRLLGRR